MKRRKNIYPPVPHPKMAPSRGIVVVALIRLNTHSIRNKALKDYKKAEQDLDRLKEQLKRYHEEDRPGFRSWIHKNFGNLLSRQRELMQAIDDKKNILFEIETLAIRYRLSKAIAYKKFLWRREHPAEAEEEDRLWEEAMEKKRKKSDPEPGSDFFSEEEDEDDPDSPFSQNDFTNIPDEAWESFSDYFEEMTGIRPPARNAAQKPKEDDKTVKELYRTIVRRLHPDHHGKMTDARKGLWHEAQTAYRNKDTNALYNILARCENGESGLGAHSAVSLIQNLTRHLKQALRSTKQEIKQVKQDPAWDYQTRCRDPRFGHSIRQQLSAEIADAEWNLQSAEAVLQQLEREMNRPRRQTRRSRQDWDPFGDLPF